MAAADAELRPPDQDAITSPSKTALQAGSRGIFLALEALLEAVEGAS